MERYPIRLTRLIHENLSIVMSFAYSRRPLAELLEKDFVGEGKRQGSAVDRPLKNSVLNHFHGGRKFSR
jgi:hypothetical protein